LNNQFDLVVIGAGPSGLALAQVANNVGKSVLIIEKQNYIGGCNGVQRVNGLFTEHSPRILSSTYTTFQMLLQNLNLNFYDLFIKYDFNLAEIGGQTIFSVISLKELLILTMAFIILIFDDNYGKNITMDTFTSNYNFSTKTTDIIDRLCRLTDGAGKERYTLNEFLELFNQQIFHALYQPKIANDNGLFKLWKDKLTNKGVVFLLNTDSNSFTEKSFLIQDTTVTNKPSPSNSQSQLPPNKTTIYYDKLVFAIPPISLTKIIQNEPYLKNIFGEYNQLLEFANNTEYIEYIPITFHWNQKLLLPKVYGFPRSPWGLAFVEASKYLENEPSKTIISTTITYADIKSPRINKTANECNQNELIDEVFSQLKLAYPNLQQYDNAILTPEMSYDNDQKKWETINTAFISTNSQRLKSNSTQDNIFTLGTHNGNSLYSFTSMESAVSNSVALANQIYPETKSLFKISRGTTVKDVIFILFFIMLILLIYMTQR
jgi:hypothetical protein